MGDSHNLEVLADDVLALTANGRNVDVMSMRTRFLNAEAGTVEVVFVTSVHAIKNPGSSADELRYHDGFNAGEVVDLKQVSEDGTEYPASGTLTIDHFERVRPDVVLAVGTPAMAIFNWEKGGKRLNPDDNGHVRVPVEWLRKPVARSTK